jgi:hypothetical protein
LASTEQSLALAYNCKEKEDTRMVTEDGVVMQSSTMVLRGAQGGDEGAEGGVEDMVRRAPTSGRAHDGALVVMSNSGTHNPVGRKGGEGVGCLDVTSSVTLRVFVCFLFFCFFFYFEPSFFLSFSCCAFIPTSIIVWYMNNLRIHIPASHFFSVFFRNKTPHHIKTTTTTTTTTQMETFIRRSSIKSAGV